ncbi:MAG: hypothetical protein NUW37_15505 [Planctomycetes bacterium]|nr:hypothetical protein [Planctomycetota bacterium]
MSEEERRYEDGTDPRLLDKVSIALIKHSPIKHQKENHVFDKSFYWTRHGRLGFSDLKNWFDTPNSLWSTGESSYSGLNNRVKVGSECGISLYLVFVKQLSLIVGQKAPKYPDSKRAVRGEFLYRKVKYGLDVTDPIIERRFLSQADGRYDIVNAALCVSLGDPYDGYYYKLIAAVIHPAFL